MEVNTSENILKVSCCYSAGEDCGLRVFLKGGRIVGKTMDMHNNEVCIRKLYPSMSWCSLLQSDLRSLNLGKVFNSNLTPS